jgi:hypothetical protein
MTSAFSRSLGCRAELLLLLHNPSFGRSHRLEVPNCFFLSSFLFRRITDVGEMGKRLANGDVEIKDLVVSKRITKEPRGYTKAGVTAIAAQQLFGSGVKLSPGQTIEYVYMNSESNVPNDRVRAFALWEGWHGYDRKKYKAMLREAFQPFELSIEEAAPPAMEGKPRKFQPGEDWASTPLFAGAGCIDDKS